MDTKKEANKYLNKHFKEQYINENDNEFKSLVRLLKKAQKQETNSIFDVEQSCVDCGEEFHNTMKERFGRTKCGWCSQPI